MCIHKKIEKEAIILLGMTWEGLVEDALEESKGGKGWRTSYNSILTKMYFKKKIMCHFPYIKNIREFQKKSK